MAHTFTGTIASDGSFTGTIDTGETVKGPVTFDNTTTIRAVLKWDKKDAGNGNVIYTSTETFVLTKQ